MTYIVIPVKPAKWKENCNISFANVFVKDRNCTCAAEGHSSLAYFKTYFLLFCLTIWIQMINKIQENYAQKQYETWELGICVHVKKPKIQLRT